MLPTKKLGRSDVKRLIMGGNIISGTSHVSTAMDGEMEDYYTTNNIKKALARCEECGINTVALRTDKHIARVLREHWAEGGKLQWIAQTASEMLSFEGNVNFTMQYKPIAFYHHGSITDQLFQSGRLDEFKERLKVLRATGLPVGVATHNPEYIKYFDDNGFDIDFYMACVYNLTKIEHVSSAISGKHNEGERFDDADIGPMYERVALTSKPCFAFKILGSTRRCGTPESVKACFAEAFEKIKPTDGVMVGMFQKYLDQVEQNCGFVREILR